MVTFLKINSSEYRWVLTSANSGVGTHIIAAAIGQRRRRLNACDLCVKESSAGYFDQHLRWIYI